MIWDYGLLGYSLAFYVPISIKTELLYHLSAVGNLLIARCVVLNISKDVFQERGFFLLWHNAHKFCSLHMDLEMKIENRNKIHEKWKGDSNCAALHAMNKEVIVDEPSITSQTIYQKCWVNHSSTGQCYSAFQFAEGFRIYAKETILLVLD